MKRYWYCRDLEGDDTDSRYLYVGEVPPIMDDEGVWIFPDEAETGNFFDEGEACTMYGKEAIDTLPKLDKGERIELRITLEVI